MLWERQNNVEPNAANHHWRSQYDKCQPCQIKYDVLTYYETMHEDVKYIFSKIAAGPNVHLVPRIKDTRQPSSNEYLKLYDTVPVSDIRRLLDFYHNDYNIFGYKIPDSIRRRLDLT